MSDKPHTLDEAYAAIQRIEEGQERIEERIITTSDGVFAGLLSVRTDLMTRIDTLQDALTAIRDDIALNFATANAARRANDNTRDEVRALADQVMDMHRQMARLQAEVRELRGGK